MKQAIFNALKIIVFAISLSIAQLNLKGNDFVFYMRGDRLVITDTEHVNFYDSEGQLVNKPSNAHAEPWARMRMVEGNMHTPLERPVILVDGINLSIEPRTLESFQQEMERGRLIQMLQYDLGYSPLIVHFSATTSRSLHENASAFAEFMHFIASGLLRKWPTATQDKFQIIGFSQGGVIGRYGAYLYDRSRKDKAGVRLLTTVDSPHQGAVLPRSLLAGIDFWVHQRGKGGEDGQSFLDILQGPGAKDLLIYDVNFQAPLAGKFSPDFGNHRWLFNEYRDAVNYRGFPVVVMSHGLYKGMPNLDKAPFTYYELNRKVDAFNALRGRVVSMGRHTQWDDEVYAMQREYIRDGENAFQEYKGRTRWEQIQGSTYPFNKIWSEVMRNALLEGIPNSFRVCAGACFRVEGVWDADHRPPEGEEATFIPTVSALDLQVDGDLAVRSDYSFFANNHHLPVNWENPGSRSSARAAYALDDKHPRVLDGSIVKGVRHIFGATVIESWRLACELLKSEIEGGVFRTNALRGKMDPNQSCLDNLFIPDWFNQRFSGAVPDLRFALHRWAFASQVQGDAASFTVPPGWQRVGAFQTGNNHGLLQPGDMIEVVVKIPPRHAWFKLDLVLNRFSNPGGMWIQLGERTVLRTGQETVVRWIVPSWVTNQHALRWAHLIMNSGGGAAEVVRVRLAPSTSRVEAVPGIIPTTPAVYPEQGESPWRLGAGLQHQEVFVEGRPALRMQFQNATQAVVLHANSPVDLRNYRRLRLRARRGTCQESIVYFDTREYLRPASGQTPAQRVHSYELLQSQSPAGGDWVEYAINLSLIAPQAVVQRLVFQPLSPAVNFPNICVIENIQFE